MGNINYLSILKKAWQISWNHKYLWWFGFFVSSSGMGGSFNYPFGNNGNNLETQKFSDFLSSHALLFDYLLVAVLIILLAFFILSIISRGALIKSIEKIGKSQENNFKIGWKDGKKYFWKVLSINIFVMLFLFLFFIVIAIPLIFLFFNKAYILGSLLAFLAVIIAVPLLFLAFFLKTYGYLYAVLGELSFWEALENSYALLRKNLGISLIMFFILIATNIALGMAILFVFIFIFIFLLIIGVILYLLLKTTGIIIAVVLGITILLPLIIFIKSAYETFAQSGWVIFFQEIAKPKIEEAVEETEEKKEVVDEGAVEGI